jgi:hypothetical protein
MANEARKTIDCMKRTQQFFFLNHKKKIKIIGKYNAATFTKTEIPSASPERPSGHKLSFDKNNKN